MKFARSLFLAILIFLPLFAIAQDHQTWTYNLGIYEVNVRQYTQAGTFAAFSEHLDRLQDMGVGILWFMPIHPIGQKNRLGSLGSYYSVQNYLDINPEFGTLEDFEALVQVIHDRGMYVIIDWVANHTSWDNVLTTEHPEWYVTDADGNFIPPPGTNWSDVIELDYSQQGLRDYMINAMKFWVDEIGVDGFRCDAVSFVPNDFWQEAITQLKALKPDIFMLAEGDGQQWQTLGFDMTHAWELYGFGNGVLKRIADGSNNAGHLNNFMTREQNNYAEHYRMYFTANHDENSWHGTTTELFGDAAQVFAVLTTTLKDMPLIYSGQEAGLDKRLQFFDKDQIIWREHPNAALYTKLLHLKRENQALWNGANGRPLQRVLTSDQDDIFAFIRERENDRVLVIANLSAQEKNITFNGNTFVGCYDDIFSEDSVVLQDSATITLPAWGYKVYDGEANTGMLDQSSPTGFKLYQNHPNPFNAGTTISFALATPANVDMTLFNVKGTTIRLLLGGEHSAGTHSVTLNATDLPSGIYFYRIQAGKYMATKPLLLLR